jgi:hypothetical protein
VRRDYSYRASDLASPEVSPNGFVRRDYSYRPSDLATPEVSPNVFVRRDPSYGSSDLASPEVSPNVFVRRDPSYGSSDLASPEVSPNGFVRRDPSYRASDWACQEVSCRILLPCLLEQIFLWRVRRIQYTSSYPITFRLLTQLERTDNVLMHTNTYNGYVDLLCVWVVTR